MTDLKKAVIYARVSNEEQSTDNQIPALLELAQRRGWEVIAVYQEEASAWKAGHQKEFAKMLKSASTHEVDVLLVWALDRITRQGVQAILPIVDALKNYGVMVVSLQEPWTEQSGPQAELLYSITAWVAKSESERRSERVKAGLDKRKSKGLPVGRIAGAKDRTPRKRTGYLLRYVDRRK